MMGALVLAACAVGVLAGLVIVAVFAIFGASAPLWVITPLMIAAGVAASRLVPR